MLKYLASVVLALAVSLIDLLSFYLGCFLAGMQHVLSQELAGSDPSERLRARVDDAARRSHTRGSSLAYFNMHRSLEHPRAPVSRSTSCAHTQNLS